MEFKTKFNIGQQVFIIDNNKIRKILVCGIKIKSENDRRLPEIQYVFTDRKRGEFEQGDKLLYRDEDECFKTVDEIIAPFKVLRAESEK